MTFLNHWDDLPPVPDKDQRWRRLVVTAETPFAVPGVVLFDARLSDDLDLDNLDLTELLHLVEACTDHEIAEDQLVEIVTLSDVVDLVVASANTAAGPALDSATPR